MKRASLDFAASAAPSRAAWMVLAAGLLSLLLAAGWWLDVHLRSRPAGEREVASTQPIRTGITAAQSKAINEAVTILNLPWSRLFRMLEDEAAQGVAFLSVEPNAMGGSVRLGGEVRAIDDVYAMLARLRALPQVAEASLLRHEINMEDAGRPVRFAVELRWRAAT
jgi:hypothetical protein